MEPVGGQGSPDLKLLVGCHSPSEVFADILGLDSIQPLLAVSARRAAGKASKYQNGQKRMENSKRRRMTSVKKG